MIRATGGCFNACHAYVNPNKYYQVMLFCQENQSRFTNFFKLHFFSVAGMKHCFFFRGTFHPACCFSKPLLILKFFIAYAKCFAKSFVQFLGRKKELFLMSLKFRLLLMHSCSRFFS